MNFITIKELVSKIGQGVEIRGWVYNKRASGKVNFLILRDGTGYVQCVIVSTGENQELISSLQSLTLESSIVIKGSVRADKRAPSGVEIDITGIEIVQKADEYPIQKKEHGTDFLLSHRHLWIRSKLQHAVLKIRDQVIFSCRKFLHENGYLLFDAPIFTENSCEGTTTLFETKYFGEKAYLAQTGQLYQEAGAMAFGKVYCLGPTFRAEKSKTRRHLTEFWMLEPEISWADMDDAIELSEDMMLYILQDVLANCEEHLRALKRDMDKLKKVKKPFDRISYEDAIILLQKNNFIIKSGDALGADQESLISNKYENLLVVHRYPTAITPFYMKPDPDDGSHVLNFDIMAPEGYGEIIGGSARIEDYETLLKNLKKHKLPESAFHWYLDLRRYGSVPHAGFGLGIERTVAYICGIKHIREAIPFPRTMTRLYP